MLRILFCIIPLYRMHVVNATVKTTNCYLNVDTDKTTVIHRYMITLTDRQSTIMLSIMGIIISILAIAILILVLYTYYHKKQCDTMVNQLQDIANTLVELNQPSRLRSVRFADTDSTAGATLSIIQT